MDDLIGDWSKNSRMVELAFLCLELPLKKKRLSVTLNLLYVLLIRLHFVVLNGWGGGGGVRKEAPPPRVCSQSYGLQEQLHRINWRNCRTGAGQRSAEQGVGDCHWLLMPEPLSTFVIFSHISLFQTHFYTLKIRKNKPRTQHRYARENIDKFLLGCFLTNKWKI